MLSCSSCWGLEKQLAGGDSFSVPDPPLRRGRALREAKRALKAEVDEAACFAPYCTRSRPFDPPKTGRIAVKVINHYGDEVLKVYRA